MAHTKVTKLATLDESHPGIYIADNVIQCSRCQFAHLYPLPDSAAVDRYYSGDYFYSGSDPHSPPDWFAKERAEYEAGLWDAYYSYLAGLLDPDRPVIDIGAGAGWFLDYLTKHGWSQWQMWGIEPSAAARRVSPIGHRLFKASPDKEGTTLIDGYGYKALKGNIILSLVLEHISDPARFLQEDVLPHLDPSTSSGRGGRLVVVVPNEWNPLQEHIINRETKLGNKFDLSRFELQHKLSGATYQPWFVSPVHVNYFNPASLRGLLERCGLTVTFQGSTAPLELAILAGWDYRGDDTLGRRIHLKRLEFERRFKGVFKVYGWLNRWLGWGREIVMGGEKR